jgi:hypothetical protein
VSAGTVTYCPSAEDGIFQDQCFIPLIPFVDFLEIPIDFTKTRQRQQATAATEQPEQES